jgi:hypothetical protein
MVLDWSDYKNTQTKLPCKCDGCGKEVYKTIMIIDTLGDCYCRSCGIKIKQKSRNLKKYGVEYPNQLEEIKNKRKQTCLEKYGVEHYLQTNEYKEKNRETNLKKYGVEYYLQSEDKKEKSRETCQLNYGVDNPSKSDVVLKRKKKTFLERYGKEHYNNRDKSKITCLEKYGVSNYNQTNREQWQIDITSSKENFENYLQSFEIKPMRQDVATNLALHPSNLSKIINNWDLTKYFDSFTSMKEKDVFYYINNLGFQCEKKKFKWGEIDCFIPSLNIGFEFNGMYWHSEQSGKDKNYHYNKTKNAEKEGIKLYHIWEVDWDNKQDIIKSWISNKLGKSENIIYARKCEIKEITTKETNKFVDKNHIQGYVTSTLSIGLIYEGELVSVIQFQNGNNRTGVNDWIISRFCSKLNTNVVGGFTKLLNFFEKKYDWKNIITYSDNSYSNGALYEMNNFSLIKENRSDYFIYYCGIKYNKSWGMKNKIIKRFPNFNFTMDMKESEMLNKIPDLLKIYDSGKKKWLKENKQ